MIFLNKEILRKLQLTELEMLVEVDRICRKYNINYSLDGGTLLGAVRHKGFIPWDDDADIMMSRSEYERFFNICKKELDTEKFFLQEFRTDSKYRWGYSKLRRNGTVFLREGQEHIKCHHGVFIDIFIFDNVPDDYFARRLQYAVCYCIRKGLYSEAGRKCADTLLKKSIYELISFIPRSFWENALLVARGISAEKETQLISHLTYPNRKQIKYGLSAQYYDEYTELDFENHRFMVIKNYDQYLRDLFDDYMVLPPVEKRKIHPVSKIKL